MNKLFKAKEMRVLCGLAIFILAVGVTGCAKKLAPEVEQQPEETVEVVSTEPVEEPEQETTQLEEGFDIQEQPTEESGAFITESPEEQPEPVTEESVETNIPDFETRSPEEMGTSEVEPMDMGTNVFEAEAQEHTEEPVTEEKVEEFTGTPIGETGQEFAQAKEEKGSEVEQMDMSSNVFEAQPQESTPIEDTARVFEQPEEQPEKIEEARLLNFEPTSQVEDVYFAFDSYDLDQKSKDRLRANAEWLKQNPNAKVEIQGHCDERGTNNYNLGLGERRALATKKFLASQGVDESRLHTISYGEEKPFCFQSDESCWWRNRRAHFMISE